MGVMQFVIPSWLPVADWPEAHRGFLSAPDQSVWPTRIDIDGSLLLCRRMSNDSSKLSIAWPVAGFGRPVLTTASLPERSEPYLLVVELARGKIVQLRNQVATWQSGNMQVPPEFPPLQRSAQQLFARAVAQQDDPNVASLLAQQALEQACLAADLITRSYASQRLQFRHRQYPQLPTSLGCSLGDTLLATPQLEQFGQVFSGVAVPMQWRCIEPVEGELHWEIPQAQVDWAIANKHLVRGGPLLDFSPNGLPPWLEQWSGDFFNLQSFCCDFVETTVSKYQGQLRIWEIAARANSGGALGLSEENRLTLVARVLEAARRADDDAQLLIRIDQPWGDYQARGQHKLAPLHFADALVRAGAALSGINLEIAIGYSPSGSASRDLLDFSRLIDFWSLLSIPLHVTLAFPSHTGPDEQVTTDLEVAPDTWRGPVSEAAQGAWLQEHIALLLAKPYVVAIFWNHLSDAQPHRFPHAGLFDASHRPKAAFGDLQRLRSVHWPES